MLTSRYHSQRRQVAAVLLLALSGLAAETGAAANNTESPKEVSLYLTVEEGDKLIQGLTQRNFRLYQGGDSMPFRLEQPETPITIALLLEYSQSSYLFFDDIQAAIQGFLDAAPEGNWYALATFSHKLEVQVDFTKQTGKIREAFSQLGQPMWNETDTYDAVSEMLDKLQRLTGRRVLIVISSGYDSFSAHTLSEVQKQVESANVTIFSVGLGSLLRGSYEPYLGSTVRMDLIQAQAFLRMLADESGGQAWFPNLEGAYPDVMKGIMQSLASQYRLVYQPQARDHGKLRQIKVEAFQVVDDKRHDFKVRVRKGWRF